MREDQKCDPLVPRTVRVALHFFDPTFITNVQDRRFLTATIYNYENPLNILGTDNRG